MPVAWDSRIRRGDVGFADADILGDFRAIETRALSRVE